MMRSIACAALALTNLLAQGEGAPAATPKPGKPPFEQRAEMYPLATCVVSGEKLDAEAVTFSADGRTFRTCCEKCQAKVTKDPATYGKKLDAAAIAAQVGHYPMTTCPVSGAKLGSMGEPVQLLLDGTLVQLCCNRCTAKAKAKPQPLVQKVREAAFAAQTKTYPLQTCIVADEKLGEDAVSIMFGTTLVRFCCTKCAAKFEQNPGAYIGKFHPDLEPKADKPSTGKEPAKAPGK